MARPPQEAIDTFKAITGASDDVALLKLEEHRGDLNAAVNAHFSEADRLNMQDHPNLNVLSDFMDIDARLGMNRFALLDPLSHPLGIGARSARNNDAPWVSHPREVREIPIEVKDGSSHPGQTGPSIQDVTGNVIEYGSAIHGPVIIDDDDDEGNPLSHTAVQNARDSNDFGFSPAPSAPVVDDATYVDNEIEEQMILAAIEASKQDADKSEDEAADYNKPLQFGPNESSSSAALYLPGMEKIWNANGRQEPGILNDETSSRSRSEDDDAGDSEEQPLTRRRSSRRLRSTAGNGQSVSRLSSRSGMHEDHPQLNGNAFSDEWAGISSEERDEAVMLEAALFGGVPNSTYPFAFPSQSLSERDIPFNDRLPRSPSPTLLAQRTLREQQDDEYMAALAADKEKELKAMQDAEYRRSEEEAAKEAALELERSQKEEAERQLLEKQEYERQLAVKQASLPQEPASDDENAVTLLIRMPDGSRQGRRFLKSEKLQCLFDFIDVGKVVKPSTYRLVRPYPRQVFGEGEKELSLRELGLTNKQEALFLEMI